VFRSHLQPYSRPREPYTKIHKHGLNHGTMTYHFNDRKLGCDRLFDPLLRICSLPRAPGPICALLSRTVQCQYVGGLVWPKKV